MLILLLFFLMHTVSTNTNGNGGVSDQYTYNLTLTHLTSRSIEVSWNCKGQRNHDKYEVTLQPYRATYKIVETVPHNSCNLAMENLTPDTNYQISVASISGRVRRRSSYLLFRTPHMEESTEGSSEGEAEEEGGSRAGLKIPNVKAVEISLVAMALILWAGAVLLFFHRWGKIRMLLPYQPAYKEMKQNGSSTCTNCSMTPHHQCTRLGQMQIAGEFGPAVGTTAACIAAASASAHLGLGIQFTETGCSPLRPRLNSFVAFNQNDLPLGMRIYRKALSCDHLPISDRFWFDDTDLSDA